MRLRIQKFSLIFCSALPVLFALTPASQVRAQTTSVPHLGHVLMVFGENNGFSSTYRSGAMPYLDSLAARYGLATNYVADTHPSSGNYLTWASGQVLTNNDSYSGTFSVDNIALDVQNAGLTWKDYVENINSSCPGLNTGGYAERHDPLAFFSNINQANRVCFTQFSTDLANSALPNLSFLAPNLCDDAHDCSLGTFDSWLQTVITPLLASPYFQPGGDGLLAITFDEASGSGGCSTSQIESGTWCGGQVETVVVGPMVRPGYQSSNSYHSESILRLFEEVLGLTAFPGASANPNGILSAPIDMSDFLTSVTTGNSAAAFFPQVAVGGCYSATFELSNTGATAVSGNLVLTDQSGNPLAVGSPNSGSASSFPVSVPPGGTTILTVNSINPNDPTTSGWAKVETTGGSLNGVVTYQRVSGGVLQTSTGVLASQPMQFATIPVDYDVTQGQNTAYALANPTAQSLVVKLGVVDQNGNLVSDTISITLGPGQQIARYLSQDLNLSQFKGSIVLRGQGGGTFVAVALTQYGQFFTAIPVIPGKAPNIPN